ncbi:hypothetical protein CL619_05380 [archaeon]|nr:hypothetical protein [archaeon]|tara:strand:- start:339 stop:1142 length:804 start_codon:yes stop_codon:yes gene_type:complete
MKSIVEKKLETAFSLKPLLKKEGEEQYSFLEQSEEGKVSDWFDKIKHIVKKYPKFYKFLIYTISPVHVNFYGKVRKFLKSFPEDSLVLNIGSGASDVFEGTVNVDLFPYEHVNVVCDASNLPLKDETCEGVLSIALLEHVPNPKKFVSQMHRVLKSNGRVLVFVPFMQGFHASPHDYNRWTESGCLELFFEFSDIKVTVAEGPTSAMLWIFQEWLAQLLSFGIVPLYKFLFFVLMLITWPIKFLDLLLRYHPMAKNITAGFIIEAKK